MYTSKVHLLHSTVQHNTVQYGTVRYSTVRYSTVQYSTVRYGTVQYSTVQYSTVQYSTVQYSTVQYSTVQLSGDLLGARRFADDGRRTAILTRPRLDVAALLPASIRIHQTKKTRSINDRYQVPIYSLRLGEQDQDRTQWRGHEAWASGI